MCAEPDHYEPLAPPVGPELVAIVPVVQLYARDVPGLVFPAGTDLLQILWCPLVHEDDQYAANPRLHWRSTALTAAGPANGEPPRPHTADGWTQPPDWPDCAGCGARMEHLLSVTATEPGMGRRLPLDDRDPRQDPAATPCWQAEADPGGFPAFGHHMSLGDNGGMYFFICRTCPDVPYTHRYDCC